MKTLAKGGVVVLSLLLLATTVEARDVYKASLDPGIPRHQAILDTLQRLEKAPKDAGLKNDLACLIAQEGFWRDALRELDEAAALDKKDGRPLFNAGLVQAMRGKWRGARSYFSAATKRSPGLWAAWWMKGLSEEKLGNARAAIEAYKVSLRVDTSLFDPAVNPYAAWTSLRAQVLLETYENRRTRAALPHAEQLSEPERIAAFFRKVKGPAAASAPEPEAPQETASAGPVIAPAPHSASPSKGPAGPVWNPSGVVMKGGRRDDAPGIGVPQPSPEKQPQPVPQQPNAGAAGRAGSSPVAGPQPGQAPAPAGAAAPPAPAPLLPPGAPIGVGMPPPPTPEPH